MARAVMLAIGGILIAVLNELSGDAFQAWIPWFTTRLLRLATERLPEDQRERFTEEWASHSNDVAEDIGKVVFAWGCVSAAGEMAAFLNYHRGTFGPAWRGLVEFVRRWKTSFGVVGASLAQAIEDTVRIRRFIMRTVLIPALVGLLAGYLAYHSVLWGFGKYVSQSVVLVEAQKVPESMVKPVVQGDFQERIAVLKAQATSEREMRPVIAGLLPNKSEQEVDSILEDMRSQTDLVTPFSDLSAISSTVLEKKPGQAASSGIVVSYIASNPRDAQRICDAVTSKIIEKNLKFIQDNANGTVQVIKQGLEDAKAKLDEVGGRLAEFKNDHPGKLSPELEGPYVALTLEFENAQKTYAELLAEESTASLTANMSNQGQGERMNLIQLASVPDAPVFPVLSQFLGGGLAVGLSLGLGLTLWSKLRGRALRAVAEPGQSAANAESRLP
jgi:hypothetical protein